MKAVITDLINPDGSYYQETVDPEGDKFRINGVSYLDLWVMRKNKSPLEAKIDTPKRCKAFELALMKMENIGREHRCRKS